MILYFVLIIFVIVILGIFYKAYTRTRKTLSKVTTAKIFADTFVMSGNLKQNVLHANRELATRDKKIMIVDGSTNGYIYYRLAEFPLRSDLKLGGRIVKVENTLENAENLAQQTLAENPEVDVVISVVGKMVNTSNEKSTDYTNYIVIADRNNSKYIEFNPVKKDKLDLALINLRMGSTNVNKFYYTDTIDTIMQINTIIELSVSNETLLQLEKFLDE